MQIEDIHYISLGKYETLLQVSVDTIVPHSTPENTPHSQSEFTIQW